MIPLPGNCSRFFTAGVPLIIASFSIMIAATGCSGSDSAGQRKASAIVGSRQHLFDNATFAVSLKKALPQIPDSPKAKGADWAPAGDMAAAYNASGYKPLWLREEGVTAAAESLLLDMDSLNADGLSGETLGAMPLKAQLAAIKGGKTTELSSLISFDTACTRAYLMASHQLLFGRLSPVKADSLWFNANDSVWLAPKVVAAQATDSGSYTPLNSYRSLWPTYTLLRAEFQRQQGLAKDAEWENLRKKIAADVAPDDSTLLAFFQKVQPQFSAVSGDSLSAAGQAILTMQWRNGLKETGKLDSATRHFISLPADSALARIRANMERLRWLPRVPDERYVIVDVPMMELFYREKGADLFHMRAVVGKLARQTPSLSARMANVVFNPSWGVPPTILKNDVLPGIARKGGAYLARKGLMAYDRRGRQVSASAINSKNYRSFNFRQPPGAHNALGDIKFNLPNQWDIYLHDTPHREDFPKKYRALSSGCVRVEKPREFAEFILARLEGRDFDQYIIDSLVNTRITRFENLKQQIPVHILYLTAFEDSTGKGIRFLPDVYRRDSKLMALLP